MSTTCSLSIESKGMTLRTSFCSHSNSASIPSRKIPSPSQSSTGTSDVLCCGGFLTVFSTSPPRRTSSFWRALTDIAIHRFGRSVETHNTRIHLSVHPVTALAPYATAAPVRPAGDAHR